MNQGQQVQTAATLSLLEAVTLIGKEFNASVRVPCFAPAKPWHIAEKQRARQTLDYVLRCRDAGITKGREFDREFNRAMQQTRDAIFAHRLMVKANTVAQTFGGAL